MGSGEQVEVLDRGGYMFIDALIELHLVQMVLGVLASWSTIETHAGIYANAPRVASGTWPSAKIVSKRRYRRYVRR